MKLEDIEVGKIYHNGQGRYRKVVNIKRGDLVGADVYYQHVDVNGNPLDNGKIRSCFITTFASWAKEIWHPEVADEEEDDDEIRVMHIYSQMYEHDDVYIVANRSALKRLKDLIEMALVNGRASGFFMPRDGEYYELVVDVDDSDWQSDFWQQRVLPYFSRYE